MGAININIHLYNYYPYTMEAKTCTFSPLRYNHADWMIRTILTILRIIFNYSSQSARMPQILAMNSIELASVLLLVVKSIICKILRTNKYDHLDTFSDFPNDHDDTEYTLADMCRVIFIMLSHKYVNTLNLHDRIQSWVSDGNTTNPIVISMFYLL